MNITSNEYLGMRVLIVVKEDMILQFDPPATKTKVHSDNVYVVWFMVLIIVLFGWDLGGGRCNLT